MAHPFFDELREETTRLPSGATMPSIFSFAPEELAGRPAELIKQIIPPWARGARADVLPPRATELVHVECYMPALAPASVSSSSGGGSMGPRVPAAEVASLSMGPGGIGVGRHTDATIATGGRVADAARRFESAAAGAGKAGLGVGLGRHSESAMGPGVAGGKPAAAGARFPHSS